MKLINYKSLDMGGLDIGKITFRAHTKHGYISSMVPESERPRYLFAQVGPSYQQSSPLVVDPLLEDRHYRFEIKYGPIYYVNFL